MANTPDILPAFAEPLDKILGDILLTAGYTDKEQTKTQLFVLSNQYNFYGAAAAFYPGVAKRLADKLEDDLYLLPSSVHEFLALPVHSGVVLEDLRELVRNTNLTHVEPQDVLSDEVYRYDRKLDRIMLALN